MPLQSFVEDCGLSRQLSIVITLTTSMLHKERRRPLSLYWRMRRTSGRPFLGGRWTPLPCRGCSSFLLFFLYFPTLSSPSINTRSIIECHATREGKKGGEKKKKKPTLHDRQRNDCNYDIVVELFLVCRICRCHYFILDVIFMNGHTVIIIILRERVRGWVGRLEEKELYTYLECGSSSMRWTISK